MSLLCLMLALLLALTGRQEAPNGDGVDGSSAVRTVQAAPANGAIEVDGRLSEAAWDNAPVASDFRQLEPDEGAPATHPTEVRVLYGESNLYIGAVLHDAQPDLIRQTLGRRDEENQADWFYVSIDSYFDRKTAYTFGVNAAGVQLDGLRKDSRDLDRSWDAIWYSDVRVTDEGWIVEMSIPYSMLRFSEAAAQTWGIQFRREIPRLSETDEWALVPRTERESGLVAQYGRLQGLQGIAPRRNLQVMPYTVSRLRTQEGDPDELQARASVDAGGDLKIGLSSNITLDATINPDFGQVESDPAVLNLSAFETFFEERRPFFIEGIQIFEFGLGRGSDLLYTRRIGAEAPIVGAAKLSGRTGDGLSFGLLGATTGENFSPTRSYGVARLTQEIGAYSSTGGMLTAFDSPSDDDGRQRSLAGGLDWDLRLAENTYGINGYASVTHLREVENTTGFAGAVEAGRIQGTWTYDAEVQVYDDHFDPNDLGRLRRNNYFRFSGGIRHQINGSRPFGPFQRAEAGLFFGHDWSYRERINQGFGFFFFSNWTTKGFQEIELRADSDHLFGGYDLYETRGLGPRAQPRQLDASIEFGTDERRTWQLEPEIGLSYRSDSGLGYEAGLEADWNIGARFVLSGEVSYGREDNVTAWASNEAFILRNGTWLIGEDGLPPDELAEDAFRPFSGAEQLGALLEPVAPYDEAGRYFVPVFGARDTRSLDFTLRSNVTFTPDLSLELYGQLFVAKGQYDDFRLLQNRDELARFDAYPKRHDFSVRSLLSNAVLRWQFQPGSELFLVWSQSRSQDLDDPFFFGDHSASPYNTSTADQLGEVFGIFPQNVFLVKLNYTFLR